MAVMIAALKSSVLRKRGRYYLFSLERQQLYLQKGYSCVSKLQKYELRAWNKYNGCTISLYYILFEWHVSVSFYISLSSGVYAINHLRNAILTALKSQDFALIPIAFDELVRCVQTLNNNFIANSPDRYIYLWRFKRLLT